MTYLKLKNNRLRISLTKDETEKIFGSAEGINKNDPKTNLALKMLFKKAVSDNSFYADCISIWIEVVKNLSGGYDIYFTKGKYISEGCEPTLTVLEFRDCEDAIKASKAIKNSKCEVADSRLYKFYDRYRAMLLTKGETCCLPFALEFADKIYTSRTEAAKTTEYGTLIIQEKAIEKLSSI